MPAGRFNTETNMNAVEAPKLKQQPQPEWKNRVKVKEIYVLEGFDFEVVQINRRGLVLRFKPSKNES